MARLYIVSTPIGHLKDISLRALEVLKSVDLIFAEDTRRSAKLLNAYEIKKPLKSCPYFKERKGAGQIIQELKAGREVAYLTDAGTPNLSDPGAILVNEVRTADLPVEVIGGVSALTYFLAGLGHELESFRFVGFLPAKTAQVAKIVENGFHEPTIFFESPHRIERLLKIVAERKPDLKMSLAKELSKISEAFFEGIASDLINRIPSWKGEWVGLFWPEDDHS